MLDWAGECVAIVAGGPSVKTANVNLLRERIHVIAIKQSYDICPFADVVYGCDAPWWNYRRGLPEFKGLKICYDQTACNAFGLEHVEIEKLNDDILFAPPGRIGSGGNSGFQALNIAVQFGATGILLVGFDVHDRGGLHWYGRNTWQNANNPDPFNFRRWTAAFNRASFKLERAGIDVVNVSPTTELTCFRHRTTAQVLAGWGL